MRLPLLHCRLLRPPILALACLGIGWAGVVQAGEAAPQHKASAHKPVVDKPIHRAPTAARIAAPPIVALPRSDTRGMAARYLWPHAAAAGSHVSVTTVRTSADATVGVVRIDVPVRPLATDRPDGGTLRLPPAKAADVQLDLGTYNTLSRGGPPRVDAAGRMVLAPDPADVQALRDASGRSRLVPQVHIGLSVRF